MTDEPAPEAEEEQRVRSDRPRFLAARSEYGYTESVVVAMHAEPEAISEADAELLAARARDRERQETLEALQARRERLQRELDYHAGQARHREKQLRRLNAKLA